MSLTKSFFRKPGLATELDAALGRNAGVALYHTVLHLDGAAYGIDHTAKLNDDSDLA